MTNESFQNLFSLAQSDKESNMWAQLADFGKRGIFNDNKTFRDLVELMLQIKKLEAEGKSKKGLRYSEHLHNFFSLLSNSSREYLIFKNMLAGMDLRSIR
jgi:hypothetical protein